MSCVFGVDAVPATLIDSRSVRCDSPVVEDAGAVALSMSINGESSRSLLHGSVNFTFFDSSRVVISELLPAMSPVLGGTAITLRGAGFAAYGTVQCKFGQHAAVNASYVVGGVAEPGTALARIVCYSPPHALSTDVRAEGGDVVLLKLSLTGDPAEFTTHTTFLCMSRGWNAEAGDARRRRGSDLADSFAPPRSHRRPPPVSWAQLDRSLSRGRRSSSCVALLGVAQPKHDRV
jgi:hypothetical protein